MSSEAFNKAFELAARQPMPNDVIAQLNELKSSIDPGEKYHFACLMEGVNLVVNDGSNTYPHLVA
jgi:hypothetical protein